MTDLERALRDRLRASDLPSAPASLETTLRAVIATPPPARRDRRRTVGLLAVAAVLVLGGGVLLATGGQRTQAVIVAPSPSTTATADASPSSSSPPTASARPTVDGLPVYTVSELQAERAAGRLSGGPIALAGYWSFPNLVHSCVPPDGDPGELEIYCHDHEYGITELDEPSVVVTRDYRYIPASGPLITPDISNDLALELYQAPINGQPYPPVPIVVVGHLDDERAAECRPQARQLCADRFVIDRIVDFDPAAVPTPGVTPPPTPFPFDSPPPPPPLFHAADCLPEGATKAPAFSFVGWMAGSDLKLTSQRDYSDETLYVAITEDDVPLGRWFTVAGDSRESLPMGHQVCIVHESDPGAVEIDSVAGTYYRVYRDGSTQRPAQ
jgi:hypothetical protein